MKQFLGFLSLALISSVNATESLPCDQLAPSVLTSGVAVTCTISEAEQAGFQQRSGAVLSPNGKSTDLILHNKGAFVAWMNVEYLAPDQNGNSVRHFAATHHLSAGGYGTVSVPANATSVRVNARLATGAFWQPVRDIFLFSNLNSTQNVWTANDNSRNKMRWDVWGATFTSSFRQLQPSDTYYNQ